jgi:DUF438 domain-containing protein
LVERKKILKKLIKDLHKGEPTQEVKKKIKDILGSVTQIEISEVEEELINEGLPIEEIHKLCDIHLSVFKESIEKAKPSVSIGHPINILLEEHMKLLEFGNDLVKLLKLISATIDSTPKNIEGLSNIIKHLKESESHYLREENVLFPYLEKHGITQPPSIMWMEHDKIRAMKKSIYEELENYHEAKTKVFAKKLVESAIGLAEMLSNHFYKENNVLFPTALKVIEKEEWKDIRIQFDEIGFCCFTPKTSLSVFKEEVEAKSELEVEGVTHLETGNLLKDEIEAILNKLPLDITFVGRDDKVKYFSQSKDRIFVRTKAIIGRKVQQCHPKKSVHIVSKILESFKNGKRDVADFWIKMNDRLIYIRYFPVRSKDGKYLGCLEITQDITDIKDIEGEKRLLDWKQ